MALESATNIADLVVTNPTSSEPKSQGDDHVRLIKSALKQSLNGFSGNILLNGTDVGAANAYVLTPTLALTAYSTRQIVLFSPSATNTGASTINISGLGVKNIKTPYGTNPAAGDLAAGQLVMLVYDGTNFVLLAGSVANALDASATAALALKTNISDLASTTSGKGGELAGYKHSGTGATDRNVTDKLRDSISVFDFMSAAQIADVRTNTGAVDVTAALQAAIDTGKSVFLPNGVYKLTGPLTLATVGQMLTGESQSNVYLVGGSHDLVRVAASHCIISNIEFRPSAYSDASPPAFASLRIYSGLCTVRDNRFLASSTGHGCAIMLDDVDPSDSSVVAGAYVHVIENNKIGHSTYEPKYGIYSYGTTNGQQATKFLNNHIISDAPIYMHKGGGNTYYGNLLQSHTGTNGTPVGNGIDIQADVTSEVIIGNYIERFASGIVCRRNTLDYVMASIYHNAWDNCTARITLSGSSNIISYFDETTLINYINSWKWDYSSQTNFGFYGSGAKAFNINQAARSFEPRVLASDAIESLAYTADNTSNTPTATHCEITGGGAARTGCSLGNGTRPGQDLYLRAYTWPVTIINNPGGTQNVMFYSNAASLTFGNTAGQIGLMHLRWDSSYGATGMWFEVSRTLV
jgi:hypothetical protein